MYANSNQPLDEQTINAVRPRAQTIYAEMIIANMISRMNELRPSEDWLCYYCLGYSLQATKYFLKDDLNNLPEDSQDRETLVAMVAKLQEIIQRRREMKGVR